MGRDWRGSLNGTMNCWKNQSRRAASGSVPWVCPPKHCHSPAHSRNCRASRLHTTLKHSLSCRTNPKRWASCHPRCGSHFHYLQYTKRTRQFGHRSNHLPSKNALWYLPGTHIPTLLPTARHAYSHSASEGMRKVLPVTVSNDVIKV